VATLAFDFDSTLVRCETLEELVAPQLESDPEAGESYRRMTEAGMAGGWTFHESLTARLTVAAPDRTDLDAFADRLDGLWTEGMPTLVRSLSDEGHEVWIVSGGPLEVLLAAGSRLGVPETRIRGVRLVWSSEGTFLSVDPDDPFSRSKVEGLAELTDVWPRPRIMIGDGQTDRAVFDAGLVDHFIAFTAHVRREVILRSGVPEARSAAELAAVIQSYL